MSGDQIFPKSCQELAAQRHLSPIVRLSRYWPFGRRPSRPPDRAASVSLRELTPPETTCSYTQISGCYVMPRTYDLQPIQRASVIRICPACGGTSLRIVTARPSDQYRDFDECTYRCACGEEAVRDDAGLEIAIPIYPGPYSHRRQLLRRSRSCTKRARYFSLQDVEQNSRR
jgi:hypothetical protein